MELLHGHINQLKALFGFGLMGLLLVAVVIALIKMKQIKGMIFCALGFLFLAISWCFEGLTYVMPPAEGFGEGMVYIGGFLGGAGMGVPLILLGLLLAKPVAAAKSTSRR
jgi:hypothetical protein